MKKTVVVMMAMLAAGIVSAKPQDKDKSSQGSLAVARGQIAEVIENPETIKSLMAGLSAEDQRQFLADVNKAIGDMPGSAEERTAKFLNVNHAALVAAKKGNLPALIAEVFATVSPDALTVLNERFASDLMNRAANPKVTYTDAQYEKICLELMEKINARVAGADHPSTRSVFAILMLVRASNGSPADLGDKLVDTLGNDKARELAKSEWIPAALGGDDRASNYEPLLASSDSGRRPDYDQVLVIAGAQFLESILEDTVGKNTDQKAFIHTRTPVLDAVENPLLHLTPILHDEPFGNGEPRGYDGQGWKEGGN